MKTVQISLNSIDKVKSFVNDITKFNYDFDLVSGRYVIDAKSIMGIFSLDLSKPIDLSIHAEDDLDEILNARVRVKKSAPRRTAQTSARSKSNQRRVGHSEADDTFKMDVIDLD